MGVGLGPARLGWARADGVDSPKQKVMAGVAPGGRAGGVLLRGTASLPAAPIPRGARGSRHAVAPRPKGGGAYPPPRIARTPLLAPSRASGWPARRATPGPDVVQGVAASLAALVGAAEPAGPGLAPRGSPLTPPRPSEPTAPAPPASDLSCGAVAIRVP